MTCLVLQVATQLERLPLQQQQGPRRYAWLQLPNVTLTLHYSKSGALRVRVSIPAPCHTRLASKQVITQERLPLRQQGPRRYVPCLISVCWCAPLYTFCSDRDCRAAFEVMCVCVCVCVRERERETEPHLHTLPCCRPAQAVLGDRVEACSGAWSDFCVCVFVCVCVCACVRVCVSQNPLDLLDMGFSTPQPPLPTHTHTTAPTGSSFLGLDLGTLPLDPAPIPAAAAQFAPVATNGAGAAHLSGLGGGLGGGPMAGGMMGGGMLDDLDAMFGGVASAAPAVASGGAAVDLTLDAQVRHTHTHIHKSVRLKRKCACLRVHMCVLMCACVCVYVHMVCAQLCVYVCHTLLVCAHMCVTCGWDNRLCVCHVCVCVCHRLDWPPRHSKTSGRPSPPHTPPPSASLPQPLPPWPPTTTATFATT